MYLSCAARAVHLPGLHQHRALVDDVALAAEDELLVERLLGQVPVDALQFHEAVVLEPEVGRQVLRVVLRRRGDLQGLFHSQSLTILR